MTDKDKLNAIRVEVQNYIDAAHKAHTNITEGNFAHLLSFIDSLQEEPVSEDLGEYTNELSKQFPDVSFAKLSRIAVRVAKWQREQMEKEYSNLNKGLATAKGLAVTMAYDKGMADAKEKMMAKAVDADCFGFQGAALFSFRLPPDKYLIGSKVKVIVIKEDLV